MFFPVLERIVLYFSTPDGTVVLNATQLGESRWIAKARKLLKNNGFLVL